MPNQLTLDERITITDLRHQDLWPTEIAIPGPGPSDSVGYIGVPNPVTPSAVKRLEKGDR